MNNSEIQIKQSVRKAAGYPYLLVAWLAVLVLPGMVVADELANCMTELLEQASDSVTVGELRTQCRQQMADEVTPEQAIPAVVVDDRLKRDRENVLQPFTLMPHKPNYFLPVAYNYDGYDSGLFKQEFNDPSLNFDDTEAHFQISLKTPLGINILGAFDIYAAYTNRSFWQVYNTDISSPFRETNPEPEAWIQFTPNWKILGFRNQANAFGIVHQSNGRGGVLSRSWDRVYANFVFTKGNFALGFKPWIRISEDADDDDNPDIADYLGHFELRAGYKWNDQVFSFMSRNNLESGFKRGAIEFGWSFPLWKYPYLNGYLQYFTGYGESLIDYNHHVNRIGIGISLTDWL